MWVKFIYFMWILVPVLFLLFYVVHRVKEHMRPEDERIIRSKYYIQVTLYTTLLTICAILINELLILTFFAQLVTYPYAQEALQIVLYPLLIAFTAPYAGENKMPETLQDKIQKHGYLNFKNRKP